MSLPSIQPQESCSKIEDTSLLLAIYSDVCFIKLWIISSHSIQTLASMLATPWNLAGLLGYWQQILTLLLLRVYGCVCDFRLICTGCMWRDRSIHPHGSLRLFNCAKSRLPSVCPSKGAQILSPVLHPESCSIGVITDYCQWSWAYGLKRVLNEFVFSYCYLSDTYNQAA